MSFSFDSLKIDDSEIDDIIWAAIQSSPSRGDFICYLVHAPSGAKHQYEARARLDVLDEDGDIRPVNYFQAIEGIQALAETGNATALFHMGKIHAIGIAVPQHLPTAISWYTKAIALGDIRSHCNMGWLYQSGYGIPEDKEKAFELLSFGSEKGIHSAKASIGVMLLSGEGCKANPESGMQLLKESFEAGYTNAGNHISDNYFSGKYIPRDSELGHEWLFKIADAGDLRTMAILGHYLISGIHGKIDVEKGFSLLEDAVEGGYLPAYLWLGGLYKNGNGIPQDLTKAKEWFEKGIAAGSKDCEAALEKMFQEIPSSFSHVPGKLH